MPNISEDAIAFFLLFSKFECALKHDGYLKTQNGKAEANWHSFAASTGVTLEVLLEQASVSEEVRYLVKEPPMVQIVKNGVLVWEKVQKPTHLNELIDCIKRVRNNLFHGGKYSCSEFDHPPRSHRLILSCLVVLKELSKYLGTGIE